MILALNNNFGEYNNYFLVGAGGAGMSAIAIVLKGMGLKVTGSDIKESRYTSSLKKEGIKIFTGHDRKNVGDADIVVYSAAIPESNVEIQEARARNIPVRSRADILSWILNKGRGVAIAGTHGKTTTTSMVSMMLRGLDMDPTIIVGGELNELGSNAIHGKSDFVIAEACESDGSFLKYRPYISVVNNIEEDHFDYYNNMDELRKSFFEFISNTKEEGWIIINGDEIDKSLIQDIGKKQIITFGLDKSNDITASNIRYCNLGSSYDLNIKVNKDTEVKSPKSSGKSEVFRVQLNVPGLHNIKNSLAAFCVCFAMGLDPGKAAEVLKYFTGVKRRFEKRGEKKGAIIFDDYAHHPSEVKATLEAAAEEKMQRIITVFQPHRYSRIAHLKNEFSLCFDETDILIITDVYGSGEQPIPGINGKILIDGLIENGFSGKLVYIPGLADIPEYLDGKMRQGDIVLLMGAGDITRVTDELFRN
ncbi:MAG: UDP-N-acetylmuramate--L-alanine ligase [Actinomycetota bacterium]|nr:MAG: UDP-N-acetylmuramate--L-alanine ligase [Actinomycetota bacterium]